MATTTGTSQLEALEELELPVSALVLPSELTGATVSDSGVSDAAGVVWSDAPVAGASVGASVAGVGTSGVGVGDALAGVGVVDGVVLVVELVALVAGVGVVVFVEGVLIVDVEGVLTVGVDGDVAGSTRSVEVVGVLDEEPVPSAAASGDVPVVGVVAVVAVVSVVEVVSVVGLVSVVGAVSVLEVVSVVGVVSALVVLLLCATTPVKVHSANSSTHSVRMPISVCIAY